MKKFLLVILVLLVCLQASDAHKWNYTSMSQTEQMQDNDKAKKKAYEKMQKAKENYIKERENYKKECRKNKKNSNNETIVFNGKDLDDVLNNINVDIDFDKIEKGAKKVWSKAMEATDKSDEDTITKNYNLNNFSAIKCEGIAQIIFTQSNKYSVKATGGKSFMDKLIVKVEKGTLVIDMAKNSNMKFNNRRVINLKIYVSAPNLSSVSLGGIANFSTKDLKGDSFTISTSGVSKVSCPSLNYNKLVSRVSGASSLNINFKGNIADIENSGASKYDLKVDCQKLLVHNSGAGVMKISGTADKTDVNSSGVSKIDVSNLNKY